MTRRTAIFFAAALASLTALPVVASASPRRAPVVRVRPGEAATSYAQRADAAMSSAQSRIQLKIARSQMSAAQRAKMTNDLNAALQVLRDRIGQRGTDGWITPQEDQDIQGLHAAIGADLTRTYGSFDSWKLL